MHYEPLKNVENFKYLGLEVATTYKQEREHIMHLKT